MPFPPFDLPESQSAMTMSAEQRIGVEKWFYRFRLPNGLETHPYGPEKLHDDRLNMLLDTLTREFGNDWNSLSCLDLACHQGWYAYNLAMRHFGSVHGIDARPANIDCADAIREVSGLSNLSFSVTDVNHGGLSALEPVDVVLMYGLIYHLEDPIGALRAAAGLARKLLVIETQVLNFNLTGRIDWGGHQNTIEVPGIFGLIDEPDMSNKENGVTGLALVPSRDGLLWLLGRLGFSSVDVVAPPVGSYEQLATGKPQASPHLCDCKGLGEHA
jgi:tRNA (mo5U34)-methyltransferase